MSRVARLLNSEVEVWREQRTSDGMGGWVTVRDTIGSVRCRVAQPSAAERVVAAQNGADLTHIVFFLPTADVRRGDELHRGSEVFLVKATYEPSVSVYLRADVLLRQAGV